MSKSSCLISSDAGHVISSMQHQHALHGDQLVQVLSASALGLSSVASCKLFALTQPPAALKQQNPGWMLPTYHQANVACSDNTLRIGTAVMVTQGSQGTGD